MKCNADVHRGPSFNCNEVGHKCWESYLLLLESYTNVHKGSYEDEISKELTEDEGEKLIELEISLHALAGWST